MMTDADLQVGAKMRHVPTGRVYQIQGRGKLHDPQTGSWMRAVRYSPVAVGPHEPLTAEYYKAISELGNYEPYVTTRLPLYGADGGY